MSTIASPEGPSGAGLPEGEPEDPALPLVPLSVRRPRMAAAAESRLRQLVDGHFDFIWRTLRGLGVSSANADDAAQQVFWIASRKLDVITPGSERAFLFSTARGVAANLRRSRARHPEHMDDEALATHVDLAPDPEQALAARQGRELLERVLDHMPEDLRTVFVLFELEGLTMAAIAELLDVPSGTVASRLRRAREEFQLAVTRLQLARGGRP